jgi:hypothetical protein
MPSPRLKFWRPSMCTDSDPQTCGDLVSTVISATLFTAKCCNSPPAWLVKRLVSVGTPPYVHCGLPHSSKRARFSHTCRCYITHAAVHTNLRRQPLQFSTDIHFRLLGPGTWAHICMTSCCCAAPVPGSLSAVQIDILAPGVPKR